MQASTPSSELESIQSALAGRYTIERELGRGGMGIVFLARDLALDRLVAIKLMPPSLAAQTDLRERFLREVRTAASLSHPNIVPIFSVEETGGLVFYVMGYIDGETLTQRVRRSGPLPPSEAARILQECAWGLGYANSRGIVHRDVKADNILIERASGRAYVTDFGIARVANSATMTAIGETLGTPQYMSPEQAAGEPLDGRSDIYSLGIVGFFALTGRLPFDAPTVQAILAMHLTKPAPPVASMRSGIPAKLGDAIDRCLAKEPGQRFPTGEALVTAIQGAQVTRAEIAPPVRMFQRVAEMGMAQLLTVTIIMLPLTDPAARSSAFIPVYFVVMLSAVLFQLRVRARALAAQGFTYDDVAAAFVEERRDRQQATAALAQFGAHPTGLARVGAIVGGVAIAVIGLVIGVPSHHGTWQNLLGKVLLGAGIVIVALAGVARAARVRSGMRSAGLSSRIWLGPFGRVFFRLSTSGVKMTGAGASGSVSAGGAQTIHTLIATLPPKQQRELNKAQRVVIQLEQRMRFLQERDEQIGAATLEADAGSLLSGSDSQRAGQERLMSDLREAQVHLDAQKARLIESLEGFREMLVRVRAGIASAADLRGNIEDAWVILEDE